MPMQPQTAWRSQTLVHHNLPAVAAKLEPPGTHDACYLPHRLYVTGDIDIHELTYDQHQAVWIVNTRFSCLCTLDAEHSFVPRWRPPFVSALAPEDRCHLNGLAMVAGRPKYATALGATDHAGEWRENKAGGGVLNLGGTMTLTNSTVSGNSIIGGYFGFGGYGGGIWNFGPLTLTNSTVSGNSTDFGGSYSRGGGVYNRSSSTLTIQNSTISGNSAREGGGMRNDGPLTLARTLVSGNTAASSPEISNHSSIVADNHNLFGHDGTAGVDGFTPGPTDVVPSGPLSTILDTTLAPNGGPTPTHALVPGSPAIDASPDDADCPTTDQRGVTRPQGAACDIGAVEADEVPATTLCSTLGDDRPPSLLDQDIFRFTGAKLDRHAAL